MDTPFSQLVGAINRHPDQEGPGVYVLLFVVCFVLLLLLDQLIGLPPPSHQVMSFFSGLPSNPSQPRTRDTGISRLQARRHGRRLDDLRHQAAGRPASARNAAERRGCRDVAWTGRRGDGRGSERKGGGGLEDFGVCAEAKAPGGWLVDVFHLIVTCSTLGS